MHLSTFIPGKRCLEYCTSIEWRDLEPTSCLVALLLWRSENHSAHFAFGEHDETASAF